MLSVWFFDEDIFKKLSGVHLLFRMQLDQGESIVHWSFKPDSVKNSLSSTGALMIFSCHSLVLLQNHPTCQLRIPTCYSSTLMVITHNQPIHPSLGHDYSHHCEEMKRYHTCLNNTSHQEAEGFGSHGRSTLNL